MSESEKIGVGDTNVERLLQKAYQPDVADPGVLPRVAEKMQATARAAAGVHAHSPMPMTASDPGLSQMRGRFAMYTGIAASLAGICLLWYGVNTRPEVKSALAKNDGKTTRIAKSEPMEGGDRLTPKAKPLVQLPKMLGQGKLVIAEKSERFQLPDGSLLYVNKGSRVQLDGDRRLTLLGGEVFIEVAPRHEDKSAKATFIVTAGQRQFSALGTKFSVRADDKGRTGLMVTQGKVAVSGLEQPLAAGQQLEIGHEEVSPTPRVSHVLDWTRELMVQADSPLVPESKYTGGALVAVDPYGQEAKLELRNYKIDVHIEDGFARTVIDQTYFNQSALRMEGTFYFPLPPDASLSRLAMYVDGNLMEGGMAERDYARSVYEEVQWSQKDPALLEWVDGSTFKMRVFPLESRQEKRIIIAYTQRLNSLYGQSQYRFPAGHSLGMVKNWSFHARVKDGQGLVCTSDTYPVVETKPANVDKANPPLVLKRDKTDLFIDGSQDDALLARDVTLNFVDPTGGQGGIQPRFSMTTHEGNRYLMMRWRPELNVKRQRENRDWVFLFESSGDRDPLLARVQIDVIRSLLGNAEYHDTFTVISAGTRVHHFNKQPLAVTPENVQAAIQFLEGSHLIGALDLGNALTEASELVRDRPNACLVHVGSGNAAMGTRNSFTLTQLIPKNAHYVGIGVGKRWNQHFMKLAAETTGGYYTQINPDEALSWRGFDLAATLNTPRLMDVKVLASSDSKSKFLVFGNTLAQGEELCAIARIGRDDSHPPTSVTVSGIVENESFKQEIPIPPQSVQADHLPRTWAKLEIDRLLAEQPTEANRKATIELSKAMYVMTPYTSLLVLENEEMYNRFKVDRGRKDHWAQYAAPQKIDVVYDPLPGMPPDRFAPQLAKPHKNQILQTIHVRMPAPILTWPNRQNRNDGGTTTALQVYTGAFGLPDHDSGSLGLAGFGDRDDDKADHPANVNFDRIEQTVFAGERGEKLAKITELSDGLYRSDRGGMKDEVRRESLGRGANERRRLQDGLMNGRQMQDASRTANALPDPASPRRELRSHLSGGLAAGYDMPRGANQFKQLATTKENQFTYAAPASLAPAPMEREWAKLPARERSKARAMEALAVDIIDGSTDGPHLYGRPSFSRNEQVFRDLLAFAPGLNTMPADIEAVIEAEAAPGLGNIPGAIDEKARPMIEKARNAGWQTLTLAASNGQPELKIAFDGQGRYAYAHTTALGLKEEVVCDGKTILHLYPDLGIGARRPVSRFHRAQFAELVPWLLAPIEDLARGVDVTKMDERTIALVPRGAAEKKDADGKPVGFHSSRLILDGNGRLTERRIVETTYDKDGQQSEKVVVVETYDGKGAVTLNGPDGKQVSKRELKLSPAEEPSLNRDTAKLVVLPLPWRSREHIYDALGLNLQTLTNGNENWTFEYLDNEKATALLAAEFSAQDHYRVQQILRRCFLANGSNKPGLWTLLAAMDSSFASDPAFLALVQANPGDPLLSYLALIGNPVYRSLQTRFALGAGERIGTEGSFFRRQAAFYDLYTRWENGNLHRMSVRGRRKEQAHALEFVRTNKSSVFGWAALSVLQNRSWDAESYREIAEAWKLFDDDTELGYAANYEHARNLLSGGKPVEAAKLYRQMYERFLKENVLPPIDYSFREALLHPDLKSDQWTDLMQKTSAKLLKDNNRVAVITIAWQCHQLGDAPLAENLLGAALANLKENERLGVTLAAVDYLLQTNQDVRADSLVKPLLGNSTYAKKAMIWRLASRVAERRGQTALTIEYLEQALDIEFTNLADVVNLQQVRNDYGQLLNHYDFLARAVQTMKIDAPKDLAARTIRAADRWRMLDRENGQPCQTAAATLKILGAREMAWDYLTTPIGMKPSDSGPWQNLAQNLSHQGDLDLADIAYTAAFQAEPTDAQILWNKALNLQRQGKKAEANKVLEQIVAKNDWQPRFNWIKSQARWQLEGR